jgi:hypothetical protein
MVTSTEFRVQALALLERCRFLAAPRCCGLQLAFATATARDALFKGSSDERGA